MSRPVVRNETNSAWIDVFCKGGWKMRALDGTYITLTAQNTKFRNADNTGYENFYCPIQPPTTITKANVRSNRLVDSNGFLWAAGYAVGTFDNGKSQSNTWRRCKMNYFFYDYIKNVKSIAAGGGMDAMMPNTTIFTHDNRILFSGFGSYGHRGNGYSLGVQEEYNSGERIFITDVTDKWAENLGGGAQIVDFDRLGTIVLSDGSAFALGYNSYYFANDDQHYYIQGLGYGPLPQELQTGVTHVAGGIGRTVRWRKAEKYDVSSDVRSSLIGIKQAIRTSQHYTFMLTTDGRLMQSRFWYQTSGGSRTLLLRPKTPFDVMVDLPVAFPFGKVKALHQGGAIETENGDLYTYSNPKRLNPSDTTDFFQYFEFVPLGINTKSFGDRVAVTRIAMEWKMSGATPKHSVFIQLDDGRLYAWGDNTNGWFGIPTITTQMAGLTLINRNVYDFDIDVGGCILVKNDGTIWASGLNPYGRLGVGHQNKVTDWQQGILSTDGVL